MTRSEMQLGAVRERLIALLREHEIITEDLPPQTWNTDLYDHALLDSMGIVHMLELVREEFGVEIDPDVLAVELTSLDAICGYICARQGER